MDDVLNYEIRDSHIAVITLNRPKQANAMNKALAKRYKEAFVTSEADPNVRVIILASSTDKVFCAGADLVEMNALRKSGGDAAPKFDLNRWPRTKPWIAAVSGPAIAGGFEMVLACDMIIATESAKFSMPEVKLGLPPGAGALHRLTRFIPHNKAIELLLTGDFLLAQQALDYGLINTLVETDLLLETALKLARKISNNAPLAVKASLEVARMAYDLTEQELFNMTTDRFLTLFESEDAKEGPLAFVEKRRPVWMGY